MIKMPVFLIRLDYKTGGILTRKKKRFGIPSGRRLPDIPVGIYNRKSDKPLFGKRRWYVSKKEYMKMLKKAKMGLL